jgi:xanthine dehydrogenase molybdopterin-binding subunit B
VVADSGLAEREEAVTAFNAAHRWRKRGITATPTKFGISFTTKFLNQAGALVHIYTDGSVLVTHGGVEMGQGLHTKVAQVAAQALGVPLAKVFIAETSTDKVGGGAEGQGVGVGWSRQQHVRTPGCSTTWPRHWGLPLAKVFVAETSTNPVCGRGV